MAEKEYVDQLVISDILFCNSLFRGSEARDRLDFNNSAPYLKALSKQLEMDVSDNSEFFFYEKRQIVEDKYIKLKGKGQKKHIVYVPIEELNTDEDQNQLAYQDTLFFVSNNIFVRNSKLEFDLSEKTEKIKKKNLVDYSSNNVIITKREKNSYSISDLENLEPPKKKRGRPRKIRDANISKRIDTSLLED